ncbi:MAG: DUF5320 domain-containing protein [Candidatus Omnitrophica bacterium]|nr:DUF5320 domain-containing protein [Candidatus Omnitrophota bacterium]
MPAGDGTGPMGLGPMTGRAAGFCAGYSLPGCANAVYGRAYGAGRGFGMAYRAIGPRRRFCAAGYYDGYPYGAEIAPQDEADTLKRESGFLKGRLEEIYQRIAVLEKMRSQESD